MNTGFVPEHSSNNDDIQQQHAEKKLLPKLDAISQNVKSRARMLVFAFPFAVASAGHAEQVVAVNSEHGTSVDAQGGVIDDPLNEAQIISKIHLTKLKIAEIEEKGMDQFSDADWEEISRLQDQLIALEKLQTAKQAEVINAEKAETAANKEAIEAKTETVENLKIITSILSE